MEKTIFNVLFISLFVTMLGLGIVSPLMPIFAENLGATGLLLGLIFASFSLSRCIFMPIIGKISDKRGRKKFIISGLLLYAILSLLYIFAKNVLQLTIIRFIHGFTSALVIPVAMAYVGETAKEGQEGVLMGTFNIAFFMGMGAGPFIGGILTDSFGIVSVFYAMFAMTIVAFFINLFWLPDIKFSKIKKRNYVPLSSIIKNDNVKGLLIYRIISAMGSGGIIAFLPVIANNAHITPSKIGVLVSTNIFLTGFSQRFFGKIADKMDKVFLIMFGSMLCGVALIGLSLTNNFRLLFLITILVGLGTAISNPAASAIMVKIGKNAGMGASMGLLNMAMSIGMIISPLIAGLVMDMLGTKYIFFVAGIMDIFATFIIYLYLKKN